MTAIALWGGSHLDMELARRHFRQDAPIHLAVALFAVVVWFVTDASTLQWTGMLLRQAGDFALVCLLTMVALRFYVYVAWLRPASPIRQLLAEARQAVRHGIVERRLPLAISTVVFITSFMHFKGAIPGLAGGFHWDALLASLDRRIHGGVQPWEWLQPIVGWPALTFVLNVNYNLWFFFLWAMFCGFALARSGAPGRTRFLLVFFLTWIVAGAVLALAFSSAGPCYYGALVEGADPYAGLMAYLRRADAVVPIWALQAQGLFWDDYQSGSAAIGISAMPSLHNAMTLLMVLAARDIAPRLRPWLIAHMALVFVGSIHLGWHYAVDAYAAFAVTAAIWFAVTPFARRWDARFASA